MIRFRNSILQGIHNICEVSNASVFNLEANKSKEAYEFDSAEKE